MVINRKVLLLSIILIMFIMASPVLAQDGENPNLPKVYLTTDPDNLYDYHKGIYTPGVHFDRWLKENGGLPLYYQNHDANYNMRGDEWEREAHVTFFEPDGTLGFSQNIGIRIHGGWTRTYDRKSLRLYARKEYDQANSIEYDIFPGLTKKGQQEPLQEFKRLILRNSGNDNNSTLFRDGLLQSLVSHLSFDTQAFRPAVLYVNGEYWGLYNLRERFDDFYLNLNYGIEREDVVLLSNTSVIEEGTLADRKQFDALRVYMNNNDLNQEKNYQYVESQLDIDNFIQYYMANIYFVNTDWPGNNNSYWRKRTEGYVPDAPYGHDGRWRFALYDTDFGFGLRNGLEDVTHNTLEFATQKRGPVWPNPDVSTVMLRNLLENESFRNRFINTFADNLNTSFDPQRVTAMIGEMEKVLAPEMEEHINRWREISSVKEWRANVEVMRQFAQTRHAYMWQHLKEFFDLTDTVQVTLSSNSQMGSIKINSMEITKDTPAVNNPNRWTGTYFKDVPIEVTAIPKPGYKFVTWVGGQGGTNPSISQKLEEDVQLTAVFIRDENDAEVNIPDPKLKAAIWETLSKGKQDRLYGSELMKLEELNLRDKGIKDITGLEYAANLVELNLRDNQLTDISPLANLVKLERLILRNNDITDINALSSLSKLRDLNIRENKITDIGALRDLTNLQGENSRLYLEGNPITDYSAVENYYALIEDVDFALDDGKGTSDE